MNTKDNHRKITNAPNNQRIKLCFHAQGLDYVRLCPRIVCRTLPKPIHFHIQPVVPLACYLLYNFTKGRRGYVDEAKIAFPERVKTGLKPKALLETQLLQYDEEDEAD